MTRPTRPYQPAQLPRLYPDDLVHPSIPPEVEQLSCEFHRAARHPEGEEAPGGLKRGDRQASEVVVRQQQVGKLWCERASESYEISVGACAE